MKKIALFIAVVVMVSLLTVPTMAAEKKAENMPIIGAVLGVFEFPVSAIKNAVHCDSFLNCINIPKHLGEGAINGAERIIGTTFAPFVPGDYERDFSENSKISQNKVLSNIVGWAGAGLIVGSVGVSSNCIFSINSPQGAWTVTGAIAGGGAAVIDSVAE